mgnify:CR=1 FL=1
MNRKITLTAAAIVGIASLAAAALTTAGFSLTPKPISTNEMPGYTPFTFNAPHHGRDVLGALYYPAAAGGRAFKMAENGVFIGVDVVEEAPIRDGEFPIVLLSHGMGGNIRSLTWLAAELADRGAIVIAVNHPNTTWGDFDIVKGMDHWTRAQDLSVALDAALETPLLQGHVDMSRVMAAGFSFGGWTALSLGGMTGNHAGYLNHCEVYKDASSHCSDLLDAGAGLASVSAEQWNASYADARVTHVFALEPGLVWGLEASNTEDLVDTVSMLSLGNGADRLLATDYDASGLAAMLPDVKMENISPATHFTGLPLCKPMGVAILVEEDDDPVCTDPEGADRAVIHTQIIDRIAEDLGL